MYDLKRWGCCLCRQTGRGYGAPLQSLIPSAEYQKINPANCLDGVTDSPGNGITINGSAALNTRRATLAWWQSGVTCLERIIIEGISVVSAYSQPGLLSWAESQTSTVSALMLDWLQFKRGQFSFTLIMHFNKVRSSTCLDSHQGKILLLLQ